MKKIKVNESFFNLIGERKYFYLNGNMLIVLSLFNKENELTAMEIRKLLNNQLSLVTIRDTLNILEENKILKRITRSRVKYFSLYNTRYSDEIEIPIKMLEDFKVGEITSKDFEFCCFLLYLTLKNKGYINTKELSFYYRVPTDRIYHLLARIKDKGYPFLERIIYYNAINKDYIKKNRPEIIPYWSKANRVSIFKVSPFSNEKYIWICENCGREFKRKMSAVVGYNSGVHCRPCGGSKGEHRIKLWLDKNDIEYIPQMKFNDLIGLRNGLLSYDFYLPKFNLLIEFQGEQHEHFTECFHIDEEGFKIQQEHDKRKQKYAKEHGIELLEIWYYDENKIEDILNKVLTTF